MTDCNQGSARDRRLALQRDLGAARDARQFVTAVLRRHDPRVGRCGVLSGRVTPLSGRVTPLSERAEPHV